MATYRVRHTRGPTPTEEAWAIEKEDAFTREWINVGTATTSEEAHRRVALAQDQKSHLKFFQGRPTIAADLAGAKLDDRAAKQSMRRIDQFQKMADRVLAQRTAVNTASPGIVSVRWEEFDVMHREYQDAQRQGRHRDFPFQPLSSYANRLQRPDGRVIRPIFQNEVGVFTDRDGVSKICVLQDRGPGDHGEKYFQVPGRKE